MKHSGSGNPNDPYAVVIRKESKVVGHVPRKSYTVCSLFLHLGGTICCKITDSERRYDLKYLNNAMLNE